MICPVCGEKNTEDALFCQECSAKLDNSQKIIEYPIDTKVKQLRNPQEFPKPRLTLPEPTKPRLTLQLPAVKKVHKRSKMRKIIIGEIILFLLLLLSFYMAAKKMYGPEKTAENHFLRVMNGNWGDVYEDLDITKSAFLSKERFVNSHKNASSMEYNTYRVNKAYHKKGSFGTSVTISYRLKGGAKDENYVVTLNKQGDKKYFLFDSWKVEPSAFICKDYKITVPLGVKVVLDGTELNSNYITSKDTAFNTYEIPEIFYGDYKLELTQENMDTINTTISITNTGYYVKQMNLKQEVQAEVINEAGNAMKAIYDTALSDGNFDQIAGMFSENTEVRTDIKTSYTNFKKSLKQSLFKWLKQADFNNIKGIASYDYNKGIDYLYVTLDYDYTATYVKTKWWTGEAVTNYYTDHGSSDFTYIFENGKWVLYAAAFNVIIY
jgi:uncharacterized membrane protein YvbJ